MDHTYTYQNQKRDLTDVIAATMRLQPTLISLLGFAAAATNRKHEYLEDVMKPQQDLAASTVNNVATAVDVANGPFFKAGDIWVNTATDERIKITSIVTNTLTIVRAAGGTAAAITTGDVLRLVARPRLEGTDPGDDAGQEPTVEFNYTQIFDRTAKVTKSAQAVQKYGIDDALDYQVKVHLDAITREINNSLIYGVRTAPTSSVPGMMGGVMGFLDAAGANRVNAGTAALTKTHLNDALEAAFIDGANDLTILCAPNQARKITALDSNYQIVRADPTSGKRVLEYLGDMAGGPAAARIVVDPNYSKFRVDLIDVSRLALCALDGRNVGDEDATPPGADYVARRILGELTLEFKNAKDCHASIYGLTA